MRVKVLALYVHVCVSVYLLTKAQTNKVKLMNLIKLLCDNMLQSATLATWEFF